MARFLVFVDPIWGQGRAVYGGVVGAGMARAMKAAVSDDKSLRSFSVTFAGPIEAGEVETLLILGGNPVYNAPADLAFALMLAACGGGDGEPKHHTAAGEDDHIVNDQSDDPAKDQSNCQTNGFV